MMYEFAVLSVLMTCAGTHIFWYDILPRVLPMSVKVVWGTGMVASWALTLLIMHDFMLM